MPTNPSTLRAAIERQSAADAAALRDRLARAHGDTTMRDPRPMTDVEWMRHIHGRQLIAGDVIAAILIGAALALLAILYFTPCQAGHLC